MRGRVPPPRRWTFSFRFWRQIPLFGLDRLSDVSDRWFVSLLERLHELSSQSIDDVRDAIDGAGSAAADALRFHKIDHDHEHVTMRREDFDWVERTYLEAEGSYPICQVHISKALGRVVGFFDENHTFNILLLDPRHNLWLSAYNGHEKRPCDALDSHYMTLKCHIDKALNLLATGDIDRVRAHLMKAIADRDAPDGVTRVVISVEAGYEKPLEKVLQKHGKASLRVLIEAGLVVLDD